MVQTRQPTHSVRHIGSPQPADLTSDKERQYLIGEAQALLTRLRQVKPFETSMPMVVGAAIENSARSATHHLIRLGRAKLYLQVSTFIRGLQSNRSVPVNRLQSAFSVLKLRFNSLLDTFDIFADVLNQRSEHETGVWLAGLDILAKDVLQLNKPYYATPPMICYLDRGHGAAIRRARTRLPGGEDNPVAVIKVPRERMVGSGIGSSLVHEAGHQGAALLGLIPSLKPVLELKARKEPGRKAAWQLYNLWISEILSDFWSVATLGISATTGLMSVVSLPAYFVFRMPDGDPHPFPWIRVKISLAFGRLMYPDPQWDQLEKIWEKFYPTHQQSPSQKALLKVLGDTLPDFARTVAFHRPASLKGAALSTVFPVQHRQPETLRALFKKWQAQPGLLLKSRPGLVFAVIGQARADQIITPFKENKVLTEALFQWAIMRQQQH